MHRYIYTQTGIWMRILRLVRLAVATCMLLVGLSANATFTLTLVQDGADVLMDGSGSLDLTGSSVVSSNGNCGIPGVFFPAQLCTGAGNSVVRGTNALVVPYSAPSANASTNITSGGKFFVIGRDIFLPVTSGISFTNQSRFTSTTLAALGVTAGTVRTYSLVSGDTLVVKVAAAPAPTGVASIPTLSEYGQMALASLMAMVGFMAVKRKRQG